MDKFAVVMDDTTKTASKGCPECGGKVETVGNVKMCENCGTKPFEKKP